MVRLHYKVLVTSNVMQYCVTSILSHIMTGKSIPYQSNIHMTLSKSWIKHHLYISHFILGLIRSFYKPTFSSLVIYYYCTAVSTMWEYLYCQVGFIYDVQQGLWIMGLCSCSRERCKNTLMNHLCHGKLATSQWDVIQKERV